MDKLGTIPIRGRTRYCLELLKSQGIKGKKVADIGSSFGWLEAEIVKEGIKTVVGIDPSVKVLTLARKRVAQAQFLQGSATDIPLPAESMDIVTLFDVIEHVPAGKEIVALSECCRILKKGGKLFLSTPNSHPLLNLTDPAWYFGHRHYKQELIGNLCKNAGLKVISLETRGSWWGMIYMIWFYIMKVFLRDKSPRNNFLEGKDDEGYSNIGVFTIFGIAQKINA